jgi:hypothetical protein
VNVYVFPALGPVVELEYRDGDGRHGRVRHGRRRDGMEGIRVGGWLVWGLGRCCVECRFEDVDLG